MFGGSGRRVFGHKDFDLGQLGVLDLSGHGVDVRAGGRTAKILGCGDARVACGLEVEIHDLEIGIDGGGIAFRIGGCGGV